MKKIKIILLMLLLPLLMMAAQENFFAKFGANIRAYFNTFYNAKVYFNESQDAYNNEEDKDQLSPQTRTALNKAAMQAEKVINNFPNSSYVDDAIFFNSVCQFQLKRYERSLEQLEKLTLEYPDSPYYFEAKLWISKCYFEMDKKTIAYDLIEQFIGNKSNKAYFSDAYSLMGYLALQEDDRERALQAFLQAAENASDKEPRCNMYLEAVELLIENQDYENALKYTDRASRNVKFDEQRARVQIAYVRIYRLLGKKEEANKFIEEGLKDARLAQYWGDIIYEQANIYFLENEEENAVSRLRYIVKDPENIYQRNRDSKAWAKAAYRLGEYYLYENTNLDSSEFFFKRALTKRRQSEEGEWANEYLNTLKQLKQVNRNIEKIVEQSPQLADSAGVFYENISDSAAVEIMNRLSVLSDTLNVDSLRADSIKNVAKNNYSRFEKELDKYLKNSDDYVGELFTLGGLFLFDLDFPDTALQIYKKIEREFYYTTSIPQAMYSQSYVWEHELNNIQKADSIKNMISERFPGSEITNYIQGRVPQDSVLYYQNQEKILQIENELIDKGKYEEAVQALKELLANKDLDNRNDAFVAFKIAWLYDYELSRSWNTQDSTLYYYHMVKEKHPGTPLASKSSLRIAAIETDISDYLAYLAGDSLKTNKVDLESELMAGRESDNGDDDNIVPHPIVRRLKSPGRPRPVRL